MWWVLPAIGAAAGGLFGGLGKIQESQREQERIDREREQARQAYGYEKEYRDAAFALQKREALETAGIQQNRLGQALGMDTANFNLALEGQARQEQAARIALADSAGAALSARGMSGTRGSDSLETRIRYEQNALESQIGLQRRGSALSLQGMTARYSNQFNDIGREIDSWNEGGYRTLGKTLEDTYRANIHGLQMQGYQDAYDDAALTGLDFLTGFLGGAAQGAGLGAQAAGLRFQSQGGAK